MNYWYIQIGVAMNKEELSQVKQDIEKLVSDVKRLITDTNTCKKEDGKSLKNVIAISRIGLFFG
jgi:hypothetical protein